MLLYRSGICKVTTTISRRLQAFVNTCLDRIIGVRWPDTIKTEEHGRRTGLAPVRSMIERGANSIAGYAMPRNALSQDGQWMGRHMGTQYRIVG